jgi:hypothetical protein
MAVQTVQNSLRQYGSKVAQPSDEVQLPLMEIALWSSTASGGKLFLTMIAIQPANGA